MQKTGVVRDLRFLNHLTGPGHPERPQRLETLYAMLDAPDMIGTYEPIPPRRAKREEILLVHSPEYFLVIVFSQALDKAR